MRAWWPDGLVRQVVQRRDDGRAAVLWSLRITTAAVASYVVATMVSSGPEPLLAPLTAMLVVQVTPVSLLASGVDRVVAVVAGVALAVGFAAVLPLTWWTLGLLIFLSITIGQALRLQANLVEVAISGMLVLGVGSLGAGTAAWQRVFETLIGAAVGIAANLLFPPKVASGHAGRAINGLADSVCGLLTSAADGLDQQLADGRGLRTAAESWLDEARRITHAIPQVGAALLQAEQGRRLNVRALGTPNAGPGLRQGLEALEHSAVAVRSVFRALADATQSTSWGDDEQLDYVVPGLAQTFREMAAGVDAFGQLVHDEADGDLATTTADVHLLQHAVDGLREAQARLELLLLAETETDVLELHAAVLSTVKRLLRELDLDERIRRQLRLLPAARAPRLPDRRPTAATRPVSIDEQTQRLRRPRGRRSERP